jgi:hypothetical protein
MECDAVAKPRLEGLRRNKGAQTSFFTGRLPAGSVPLKGETKSKRAGRMPALQRRKLKGNCADQRPVFLVFGFDFFVVFHSTHSGASIAHVEMIVGLVVRPDKGQVA